jgi:hypothetical protein
MIPFITDEDFNGRIVHGLLRRISDLDLIRIQDIGLSGASDEKLLEWAADNDRAVLTHDKRTMPWHAHERLRNGLSVPGVFVVDNMVQIGVCVDELLIIAVCSTLDEWRDRVIYVPMR